MIFAILALSYAAFVVGIVIHSLCHPMTQQEKDDLDEEMRIW